MSLEAQNTTAHKMIEILTRGYTCSGSLPSLKSSAMIGSWQKDRKLKVFIKGVCVQNERKVGSLITSNCSNGLLLCKMNSASTGRNPGI